VKPTNSLHQIDQLVAGSVQDGSRFNCCQNAIGPSPCMHSTCTKLHPHRRIHRPCHESQAWSHPNSTQRSSTQFYPDRFYPSSSPQFYPTWLTEHLQGEALEGVLRFRRQVPALEPHLPEVKRRRVGAYGLNGPCTFIQLYGYIVLYDVI
jgi:hypothetical protein